MKSSLKLVTLALVSASALAGCSVTSASTENSEVKEAGLRGSRICLTNASSVPMSAVTGGTIRPENADHIVGKAGALSDQSELCFAGYNSFETGIEAVRGFTDGTRTLHSADASVSVSIDGNYNAFNVYADNPTMQYPRVAWGDESNFASGIWNGRTIDVGESTEQTSAGHTFTLTRRDDSEYFKEFTIRFTK